MNPLKTRLACAAAALAAVLTTSPAIAQDKPVELKFAHWLPATHPLFRTGFEPWAKSVEAASKGSIKVVFFPAQQLGKAADHYDMARDGIADMAWVNPGYQAGRFPMYAAGELPFLMGSPGPASAALDAWYRTYAAKEMADVKFCFGHLHVGALHSKQPITEPTQFKGMQGHPQDGNAQRAAQSLLRVVHEQGARADEGERQSRADRTAGRVGSGLATRGSRLGRDSRFATRIPDPDREAATHLTNTFGMMASGSPRRKTRRGAVSVCRARRSPRPRNADSRALRSELPKLASDSYSDRFGG
jgi:hypothetical protein